MYVSVKGKKEYEGAKEKNFRFKIQLGFVSGVASTENFRSKGACASLLSLSSRRRRVRVKKGARTKSERERESSRSPKQSHLCVVVVEEKERKHFVLGETRFINIRFKYKTFEKRFHFLSPSYSRAAKRRRLKEEEEESRFWRGLKVHLCNNNKTRRATKTAA